jgi:hypothetical protein
VVRTSLVGQRHTRGILQDRFHNQIEFIAFKFMPEEFMHGTIDVLATPQINNYMGSDRVQLNITDLRMSY